MKIINFADTDGAKLLFELVQLAGSNKALKANSSKVKETAFYKAIQEAEILIADNITNIIGVESELEKLPLLIVELASTSPTLKKISLVNSISIDVPNILACLKEFPLLEDINISNNNLLSPHFSGVFDLIQYSSVSLITKLNVGNNFLNASGFKLAIAVLNSVIRDIDLSNNFIEKQMKESINILFSEHNNYAQAVEKLIPLVLDQIMPVEVLGLITEYCEHQIVYKL